MQYVRVSAAVLGVLAAGMVEAADVAYRFRPVDIADETGVPGAVHLVDLNRAGQLIGNAKQATAFTVTKRLTAMPARCPDDVSDTESTTASAINNLGQVVGTCLEDGQVVAYIRGRNGAFTFLRFPGAEATIGAGINDRGEVVGHYGGAAFGTGVASFHGFVWRGGQYATIDAPFEGAMATNVTGITNAGQMIGTYLHHRPGSADPNEYDSEPAFLLEGDTYTLLAFPGAVGPCCEATTLPMDINNLGQILLATYDGAGARVFALVHRGQYRQITGLPAGVRDVVGAWGLNDLGELAGAYEQAPAPCPTCPPGDGPPPIFQSFLAQPAPVPMTRVQHMVLALKLKLAHERQARR